MDIRVPKMNVVIVSSFFLPLNQIRHSVHEKNDKKKTKNNAQGTGHNGISVTGVLGMRSIIDIENKPSINFSASSEVRESARRGR